MTNKKVIEISEFNLLKVIIRQNINILSILQLMNISKLFPNKTITKFYEEAEFRKIIQDLKCNTKT